MSETNILEQPASSARGSSPAPCSVESVNRQVIENQLLAALDDKSKVAILATEEDLTMLIICLGFSTGVKAKEMRADLQQLKAAAFPPNDGIEACGVETPHRKTK